MFNKVVVANRGAVAARVLRALRALSIRSVAVYSEADAGAPYLEKADETFAIGAAPARESYLNQDALVKVIRESRADGLHPGYGFLAENTEFAARVESTGARFIGPAPYWIDAMGHKTRARDLAAKHGLPVGSGSGVLSGDQGEILAAARSIGFPVLVKPAAGGGGIGMISARDE
ncbi:MAG: biotin carboxylase, partial [Burkholderiales bacterium]|nr:biotin carboxylase [Burkholderiales bacterium]